MTKILHNKARTDLGTTFLQPGIELVLCDYPVEILRHWYDSLMEESELDFMGMPDEEFLKLEISAYDAMGESVIVTVDAQMNVLQTGNAWGFTLVEENKIFLWVDEGAEEEEVLQVISHELGHLAIAAVAVQFPEDEPEEVPIHVHLFQEIDEDGVEEVTDFDIVFSNEDEDDDEEYEEEDGLVLSTEEILADLFGYVSRQALEWTRQIMEIAEESPSED